MLTFVFAATLLSAASLAAGFTVRARVNRSRHAWAAGAVAWPPDSSRWTAISRSLLRRDRAIASLAIWLMILDTALALAAPWPLQVVVDYGLGQHRFPPWLAGLHGLPPLGLAMAAAAAGLVVLGLGSLTGYLVTFLVGVVSGRMGNRLRVGLVDHLLRAAPRAVSRFPLGELASRLGPDAGRVTDTVTAAMETLIPDLTVLAGMTAITAMLDWRLTLIVLGVVPLYTVAARLRNRSLRGAQQQARARAGELSAHAADLLGRMPAVHVFGRSDSEVAAYHLASTDAATAEVSALDASARFAPVTDSMPGLGLAAALIAGTAEVSAGRLTIGGLLVFLAYLSSLTGPVRSLAQLSTTITRGTVSRERVSELLRLPLLAPGRRPPPDPASTAAAKRAVASAPGRVAVADPVPGHSRPVPGNPGQHGADLEIFRVRYAHRPGHPVLDSASLRVRAGELVCIAGPSGAGKSTLLSLLVRLADPDSGVIRIDGHDIAGLPPARLRRTITLVPQDPWLHSGTIAGNISYASPAASRAQIEAVAEVTGVAGFASRLPAGLDTAVGEHGRQLSGGQQRRIAVARALMADTPVLLLDEPTAGLDHAAEEKLIAGLLECTSGKTVVLVTHAERLAVLASRVVWLEHGQLRPASLAAPAPGRALAPAG